MLILFILPQMLLNVSNTIFLFVLLISAQCSGGGRLDWVWGVGKKINMFNRYKMYHWILVLMKGGRHQILTLLLLSQMLPSSLVPSEFLLYCSFYGSITFQSILYLPAFNCPNKFKKQNYLISEGHNS